MFQLLMPRKPRRPSGRSLLSRAVTALANATAEFRAHTSQPSRCDIATTEPDGLFGPGELPPVEDITAAAAAYNKAAEAARAADRGKRGARKLLDRLPAGLYGAWSVERVPSGRQTVDLDAVRALFKQHGLGPVPMKASADSLKVTRVVPAVAPMVGEFEQIAAAFSGKVPAGVA